MACFCQAGLQLVGRGIRLSSTPFLRPWDLCCPSEEQWKPEGRLLKPYPLRLAVEVVPSGLAEVCWWSVHLRAVSSRARVAVKKSSGKGRRPLSY